METEIFICQCNSIKHQIVFRYFEDDDYHDVYVSIYMANYPFWKRLKNAFLYILGRKSKYGDFEEFIFDPRDADKLQKVVDYLKANK